MPTPRQELALQHLPAFELAYYESCALLNQVLTPAQRLARQGVVRTRLAALNQVRDAAGLDVVAGPRLLTVDELLQPTGKVAPAALQAALAAVEAKPGLFCVVAQYAGTNALAA